MNSTNWARDTERHGLHHTGLGHSAAVFLRDLGEGQLPLVQPRPANGHRQYQQKPSNNQGQLIRHGMLSITPERSGYRITPKGREWLARLIALKILSPGKEMA